MNSYELSRSWFDFSFENPHKINPYHTAIYFFAIEHCNRLGWKKVFGFPTSMVLEAIGMKSYNSYKKHFDELADFGFLKVHQYSKNQYSSNIIELTLKDKALDKALDKAFIKHDAKQRESTDHSIVSIDKPLTKEPINHKYTDFQFLDDFNSLRVKMGKSKVSNINTIRDYQAKAEFKELVKYHTKEDFVKAITALFKQQQLPGGNTVMFSDPKHLILHFNRYLDAYENKNSTLYGAKPTVDRL